jgi:hypothetical protein
VCSSAGAFSTKQSTRANDASMKSTPAEEHTILRYSTNLHIGEISSTCKFMGVGQSLNGQALKSKQLPRKLHAMIVCEL